MSFFNVESLLSTFVLLLPECWSAYVTFGICMRIVVELLYMERGKLGFQYNALTFTKKVGDL